MQFSITRSTPGSCGEWLLRGARRREHERGSCDRRKLYFESRGYPATSGIALILAAAIGAGPALQSFHSFFRDDRNHDQSREGIGPPQSEKSVKKQTHKQDGRRVGAKFRLSCVRIHGDTSQRATHLALFP